MLVIWADTKERAEAWRRRAVISARDSRCIGNASVRSLDGMRVTQVIQLDGSGVGPLGAEVGHVLERCARKTPEPVPWLDLQGGAAS